MPDLTTVLADRRVRILVAAVLLALVGSGVLYYVNSRAGLPDGVAFEVDGSQVPVSSVRDRAGALKALYGVELPADDDAGDFWKDVAQSMVVARLLEAEAEDRDTTVSEEQAQATLDQYVTAAFGTGEKGRRAYRSSLGKVGTSDDEVVAEIRRQLLVSALFQEVTADVAAPDEGEVRSAFERWRCHLGTPEKRRILNIVVADRASAVDVLESLRSGTPFADLARSRSLDAATAADGGDLGSRAASELDAGFARAAFAARLDVPFGPVRSEHGWNVGVVVEIHRAEPPRYSVVRPAVADRVLQEDRVEEWQTWLEHVVAGAEVRYADDYRPKDPDALPAEMTEPAGGQELEPCER